MSENSPPIINLNASKTTAGDELPPRYPPFPLRPNGVTIVPFGEFKPAGYRRVVNEEGVEIEVDGSVGLPTIKVLNEEEVAKKRKDKKRRRTAGNATGADGRLIPWWEEWEEGEASRETSIRFTTNGQMNYEDRVLQASEDFRVGRTWPEISSGVRAIWDQFRLFIGLVSSIPIYKRVKTKSKGEVNGPNNGEEASDEEDEGPRATQINAAIVQDYLEQAAAPGKQIEPSADMSGPESQRLLAFVDDMEKTVKIFLTSHMSVRGFIWTERNLFIAPTVVHFFLRFMFRNQVFFDSQEHIANLKRAIAIAELARKELPLTAKIAQNLPGKFDVACKECWGTKGSLTIQISTTLPHVNDLPTDDHSPARDSAGPFEKELIEQEIEVVPSDVVLDSITARQALEDNLDSDVAVPVTSIPAAGDPWTAAILAEHYTTASWTDVSLPSLMQFLGPTVLPLTLTTGIVESSTRRIERILPPEVKSTSSAVEQELERLFCRVVLSPWIHSAAEETEDFRKPIIAAGSNGAVIAEFTPDGTEVIEDNNAYDPYNDDVTILVPQETAANLGIGMGLCGTWVEMSRVGEGKRHPRESYWYMESLLETFASFYMKAEGVFEVGESGGGEGDGVGDGMGD